MVNSKAIHMKGMANICGRMVKCTKDNLNPVGKKVSEFGNKTGKYTQVNLNKI